MTAPAAQGPLPLDARDTLEYVKVMGTQLDLFGRPGAQPRPASVKPAESSPPTVETPPKSETIDQMDLFGDRWLRASRAHQALRSFDLDAASVALRAAVELYPNDQALREREATVSRLASVLRRARRMSRSPAKALGALERLVPSYVLPYYHAHLAAIVEEEFGSGATLGGVPAGLHWLRAGQFVRAEESLRVSVDRNPTDGRARAYLADTLMRLGRDSEAGFLYRDALASSPTQIDFENLVSEAVRLLPHRAELEYEVEGHPAEWAAAVGLLDGIFVVPSPVPSDWTAPDVVARLPSGIACYRWLVVERTTREHESRIASRRAIRELCPLILRAILERRVG
jgi:hypothetical protein